MQSQLHISASLFANTFKKMDSKSEIISGYEVSPQRKFKWMLPFRPKYVVSLIISIAVTDQCKFTKRIIAYRQCSSNNWDWGT